MDSSSVLLALDEREKWRARRKRIMERLRQIERRKAHLVRDLEVARKKIADYERLIGEPAGHSSTAEPVLSSQNLLR